MERVMKGFYQPSNILWLCAACLLTVMGSPAHAGPSVTLGTGAGGNNTGIGYMTPQNERPFCP